MRGLRAIEVTNGDGLTATIVADRAGDLYSLRWQGRELGFFGASGIADAAVYGAAGRDLRRSFSGFLITCGLRNAGPAEGDEPMHGRIGQARADSLAASSDWDGDDHVTTVEVVCREASLFGPHLELVRRWRVVSGSGSLQLTDIVRNQGFAPEPLLLMYHFNFGYPMLDQGTLVEMNASAEPRDEAAHRGLARHLQMDAPVPGVEEEVFFATGASYARVLNQKLGLVVEIAWDPGQLPCLTEWKSMAAGHYALGLEPGTCHPVGRAAILERGTAVLDPGDEHRVDLTVSIRSDPE
jgi:hypothetical protein